MNCADHLTSAFYFTFCRSHICCNKVDHFLPFIYHFLPFINNFLPFVYHFLPFVYHFFHLLIISLHLFIISFHLFIISSICFSDLPWKSGEKGSKDGDGNLGSSTSKHWQALMSFLGYQKRSEVMVSDSEYDEEDEDEADSVDQPKLFLPSGSNMILRVQNLKYTERESDQMSQEYTHRRASESPRKNGSSSPRKSSRDSPGKVRSMSQPKSSFRLNNFLQQPTTIYLDMSDVENQLQCSRSEIPCEFYACLQRLPTPTEQMQDKYTQKMESKNSKKLSGQKTTPVIDSPDSSIVEPADSSRNEKDRSCVVRVVVIDRRRKLCSDHYSVIVRRILEEQPMLKGHVIIPDMLRRYLNLPIYNRVWLQVIKNVSRREPTNKVNAFSIHPLGNVVSLSNNKFSY